jgi:hypothetical protein
MSEELRPHPYPADKHAWLTGADHACNTARTQTAGLANRPSQTSEQLLAVLTDAIKFESELLNANNSLPTPHSDRALLAKLRTTFTRAVAADQTALAALTAQWDAQKFNDLLAGNATAPRQAWRHFAAARLETLRRLFRIAGHATQWDKPQQTWPNRGN